MGIFASNRPEWTKIFLACMSLDVTVVTLYATLGVEALVHCVKETSISTIVCDEKSYKTFVEAKEGNDMGEEINTVITLFDPN